MAAPKDSGDSRNPDSHYSGAIDPDVDFAGYDPYIVALTGGTTAGISSGTASIPEQATESRKVKLMTWLREHSN